MDRFRGKAKPINDKGPNLSVVQTIVADPETTMNVSIWFKKGNKEPIKMPCIVISFDGEEMRTEEHMRGVEIESIVGQQDETGGVDTLWSAPHPDPCDVMYEFLLYGRNSDECKILASEVKRLFPQKWFLPVRYGDGSISKLSMHRLEGPIVSEKSELTIDSFSVLDAGPEVWLMRYSIEGYDDNVYARRYETAITHMEVVFNVYGDSSEPEEE